MRLDYSIWSSAKANPYIEYWCEGWENSNRLTLPSTATIMLLSQHYEPITLLLNKNNYCLKHIDALDQLNETTPPPPCLGNLKHEQTRNGLGRPKVFQ